MVRYFLFSGILIMLAGSALASDSSNGISRPSFVQGNDIVRFSKYNQVAPTRVLKFTKKSSQSLLKIEWSDIGFVEEGNVPCVYELIVDDKSLKLPLKAVVWGRGNWSLDNIHLTGFASNVPAGAHTLAVRLVHAGGNNPALCKVGDDSALKDVVHYSSWSLSVVEYP